MNIQGSINQLLTLAAVGIKSDAQLQNYRALEKQESTLRKTLDTLIESAGKETEGGLTVDPEKDINEVYDKLSSIAMEKYQVNPSVKNYQKTYDIEQERIGFKDWYANSSADKKWNWEKYREEQNIKREQEQAQREQEKQNKIKQMRAEYARAKAQEDMINRVLERTGPRINFERFLVGGDE